MSFGKTLKIITLTIGTFMTSIGGYSAYSTAQKPIFSNQGELQAKYDFTAATTTMFMGTTLLALGWRRSKKQPETTSNNKSVPYKAKR